VPTKKLPKCIAVGREVKDEDIATTAAFSNVDGRPLPGEAGRSRGQILWMRSISRLQQQVGNVTVAARQAAC